MKSHFILAILVAIMLWLHVPAGLGYNGLCLIVPAALFVLHLIVYIARLVFRNIVPGRLFGVAEIVKHKDATELMIHPSRPWVIRPGQYIYLRAPATRFRYSNPFSAIFSLLESHPFMVVWWNNDTPKADSISLLVKEESGFTKALAQTRHKQLRVFIDGPYGNSHDFHNYDSIIMVATGIGITAQLPYIKELLQSKKRPKRISLVWEIEDECS
jgi:predicted ferric reductase